MNPSIKLNEVKIEAIESKINPIPIGHPNLYFSQKNMMMPFFNPYWNPIMQNPVNTLSFPRSPLLNPMMIQNPLQSMTYGSNLSNTDKPELITSVLTPSNFMIPPNPNLPKTMMELYNPRIKLESETTNIEIKKEINHYLQSLNPKIKVEHEETDLKLKTFSAKNLKVEFTMNFDKSGITKIESQPKCFGELETNTSSSLNNSGNKKDLRRSSRSISKTLKQTKNSLLEPEEKLSLINKYETEIKAMFGDFEIDKTKLKQMLVKNKWKLPAAVLTAKKNKAFYIKYFNAKYFHEQNSNTMMPIQK